MSFTLLKPGVYGKESFLFWLNHGVKVQNNREVISCTDQSVKDRILVFPASYDFDFVWIAERHYPYLRMDSDVDDVRLLFENDHSKSILIIIPESIFYGLVLDCIEWIPWQTRKKVCAAQYHCGELYTSFIAASLLKKGFLEIKNESWYSFFLTEEKHS